MFPALLVSLACLTAEPPAGASAGSPTKSSDLALYNEARARLGRGADAHVHMALWCEAHGLYSERLKHLVIAVLTDPGHATARGLLGLVAFRGQWQSPEAIHDKLTADETSAAMAGYNGRRARMDNSADAHWKIAMWCEQHGLKPEATAHLTVVTQLDPSREAAWKRLGYKKQGRRWVTDLQLAAEKAEAEAQKKADKRWTTLLAKLRSRLEDKSRQAEATKALQGITDPRAVPSVWTTFASSKASDQKVARQLLGQIDSPGSTHALTLLAVVSDSAEVRSKAIATLRCRDPRDITSLLVRSLRDPELDPDPILYHYLLQPIGWDAIGSTGFLVVQGPRYDIFRTYTVDESRSISSSGNASLMTPMSSYPGRVMLQRQRQVLDLEAIIRQISIESESDVLAAKLRVRQVDQLNARIIRVLTTVTEQNSGKDQEAWRKWWIEEQGYSYEPPAPRSRQDWTLQESKPAYADNVHFSCFAAGTPVHTLTGLRPIESVRIADQILTQEPRTGALSFQPVVAAVHNKPDRLLKISLDREVVSATGIHRFWRVGQGWVMARDLKPGDVLRALGGVASVKAVESDGIEPVFNLVVMQAQSFFVGERGMLVHDNSLVEPVLQPFDSVPDLAAIVERPIRSHE
ncbi:MAG: polymorphic toxin-type HINT domain-containing protein [Isosphaerales bacterium]